jgi:predicted O-linked N-acetylglucosamine transferase (SPINDLY family)
MAEAAVREAVRLQRSGRLAEAERAYREHLSRQPDDGAVLHLLGMLCQRTGKVGEALDLVQRSVAVDPSQPDFHSNLAGLLGTAGRLEQAADALRRAVALRPGHAPSHHNLGVTLERLRQLADAEVHLLEATRLAPRDPQFQHHLGNVRRKRRLLAEAVAAYEAAVALDSTFADAWTCLATTRSQRGDLAGALAAYRRACDCRPNDPGAFSNLCFESLYDPDLSQEDLFRLHQEWAARFEVPLADICPAGHPNDRTPSRRLRVGYVSNDFREHTRMRFIAPFLAHHDHHAFEVVCYSDVRQPDATTQWVRGYADAWRNTGELPDERLAALIAEDQIDVLVELTGHMGENRLPVFARRPAPVQVAYPGYPATTGLTSITHLLTDRLRDPLGCERYYSEELVYLEPTSQCYWPGSPGVPDPPVVAPPCLAAGHVTFGALNKPVKANDAVVATWARVLAAVPDARLAVLNAEQDRAGRPTSPLLDALVRRGVPPGRIVPVPAQGRAAYLGAYGMIDVALDPWPYNGHTTTLDALWMGVPVVALRGSAHVSRESQCLLSLLGLDDLVADDSRAYVEIASRLATDFTRLAELRSTLRSRMERSALCDARVLTRKVEDVYRTLWSRWCNSLV